jgi:TRAP transporter TAXI family solute receptor
MRLNRKRMMIMGLMLALTFSSVTAFSADWQVPTKWKYIKFAGGAASGSWTPLTAKVCELINKNIRGVQSSSTLGSTYGNLASLNSGQVQMAMTLSNALAECYYRIDPGGLKAVKHAPDIRFLASMHYGALHAFVRKDSDIKSFSDLAKRPVSIISGPMASSAHFFNNLILKTYGSSIEDLEKRGGIAHKVYNQQGVNMMKDGKLDMVANHTGLYASWVMDAATSPGIRFLEFEPDTQKQLMEALYGSVDIVIPKDMYPGIEKDYHTFGYYFPIAVHKNMPDELSYRITKIIWENLKEIQSIGAFGKDIKWETCLAGNTIPIHPGAERYYKERGVSIPPLPDMSRYK